jgi:hypothetical protein
MSEATSGLGSHLNTAFGCAHAGCSLTLGFSNRLLMPRTDPHYALMVHAGPMRTDGLAIGTLLAKLRQYPVALRGRHTLSGIVRLRRSADTG